MWNVRPDPYFLEIDPNNGDPDRVYALALIQNGESKRVFEKAEKALRDTLLRLDDSKWWQVYLTLSYLLLDRGEKIDNSKPPRWSYFLLSNHTYYEEALEKANKVKTLKPTDPDAYFYSGIIQYKLGEHNSALEDF